MPLRVGPGSPTNPNPTWTTRPEDGLAVPLGGRRRSGPGSPTNPTPTVTTLSTGQVVSTILPQPVPIPPTPSRNFAWVPPVNEPLPIIYGDVRVRDPLIFY